MPTETIVVRRRSDLQTARALGFQNALPIREVTVDQGGAVRALLAGVRASTCPIVAITDDDAIPRNDWLERMMTAFQDPIVGGIGGRDVISGNQDPSTADVGHISRWGKVKGNHHRGEGGVREVAVLKGVNSGYRREALELPLNLRGSGVELHWELAVGFRVRERGWRLLYDPQLVVDHYPAAVIEGDHRNVASRQAVKDAVWNQTFIIGSFDRRLLYKRVLTQFLIGTAVAPGVVRMAIAATRAQERRVVLRRVAPAMSAMFSAAWAIKRGQHLRFVPSVCVVPEEST